jgi:hypothetical protein
MHNVVKKCAQLRKVWGWIMYVSMFRDYHTKLNLNTSKAAYVHAGVQMQQVSVSHASNNEVLYILIL